MNASQEPAPPHQPGEPATAHGGYGGPESAAAHGGYGGPESATAHGGYGGPEGGTVGYGTPEGGFGLSHPSGPSGPTDSSGGFGRVWNIRASSSRPWKRTAVVAVGSFLAVFALGGPLGVLWHFVAPAVPVINAGQQGVVVNDPSPEEYIAADGWFALLGVGFGLLVAIAAWLLLRRDRGPFLLLGVVLGTLGAGWLVAPWIGEMIGRGGYQRWLETAQQGSTYLAPPEVHSLGPTLVPAFVAAVALTLLAGWSNDPDLDRPGAYPGYGPNSDPDRPGVYPGYGPNSDPDLPGAYPGHGPNNGTDLDRPGAHPGWAGTADEPPSEGRPGSHAG